MRAHTHTRTIAAHRGNRASSEGAGVCGRWGRRGVARAVDCEAQVVPRLREASAGAGWTDARPGAWGMRKREALVFEGKAKL